MSDAQRIDIVRPWPAGYKAMVALEAAIRESGFDTTIFELVKTPASHG